MISRRKPSAPLFFDQAHAPVYVLEQKEMASVDNLEVDAEAEAAASSPDEHAFEGFGNDSAASHIEA